MVDQHATIGSLVKRFREARGTTQRELAATARMSLGALRDLEQGRTCSPRWGIVEDIGASLHLSQHERAELALAWRTRKQIKAPGRAIRRSAGQRIRIEVLGPVTAWRDGELVALGPARQRAVLGLLAVHLGASVHRDAIVHALWPGFEPGARAQLQSYISRLRKALCGKHGSADRVELITTSGVTYRLDADGDDRWLDVADFQQLSRHAAQALSAGLMQEACRLYEQGLALWHGDVLADIDHLREYPAATGLVHQRTAAVIGFANAALGAHTPHIALPRIRQLCAEDPYNEAAHAQLMILLASVGQQAAALDIFAKLHRRLADELGITPGPAVRQAHERVLCQRLVGLPASSRQQDRDSLSKSQCITWW